MRFLKVDQDSTALQRPLCSTTAIESGYVISIESKLNNLLFAISSLLNVTSESLSFLEIKLIKSSTLTSANFLQELRNSSLFIK